MCVLGSKEVPYTNKQFSDTNRVPSIKLSSKTIYPEIASISIGWGLSPIRLPAPLTPTSTASDKPTFYHKRLPSPPWTLLVTSPIFLFPRERSFPLGWHPLPECPWALWALPQSQSPSSPGLSLSEPPSQRVSEASEQQDSREDVPGARSDGQCQGHSPLTSQALPVTAPPAFDFLFSFCFRPYTIWFACLYILIF